MTEFNTRTKVRRVDGNVVIDVGGEITNASEAALGEALAEAASDAAATVILNFADLDYMNSGGIGVLVTLLIRANREGMSLLACDLGEHYRKIFSLTRLDEAIACFDDEASALAAAI